MKLFLLFIMVSCASSMGKVVIERMDDVDEKPSWATLSKPYFKKGEKTFVIGFAEASGTSNISLLNDIASNNGKNRLARYVETEMLSVFQNSIDGVENRNEMARKYASEKSSLYLREIIEENVYFEKTLYYDKSGDHDLAEIRTQMYVLISIPSKVIDLIKDEAISNKNNNLKKSRDKQFEKLMNNE